MEMKAQLYGEKLTIQTLLKYELNIGMIKDYMIMTGVNYRNMDLVNKSLNTRMRGLHWKQKRSRGLTNQRQFYIAQQVINFS